MKTNIFLSSLTFIALIVGLIACTKEDEVLDPDSITFDQTDKSELPVQFQKFYDNVEIYIDGNEVVLRSNGVPNHNSPYFSNGDSRHEAYNGDNNSFHQNPNSIGAQNYEFRIPLTPTEATNHSATPMGAMGIAINGVPIFNQYAAGRSTLDNEINSFDQYNGHPAPGGVYHYHIEPLYLTAEKGKDALIGFLLDGFPVYGPYENGNPVANSDLDDYHGHTHATDEYPEGIYHYHITSDDPYINGDGFYGNAGTVSR